MSVGPTRIRFIFKQIIEKVLYLVRETHVGICFAISLSGYMHWESISISVATRKRLWLANSTNLGVSTIIANNFIDSRSS